MSVDNMFKLSRFILFHWTQVLTWHGLTSQKWMRKELACRQIKSRTHSQKYSNICDKYSNICYNIMGDYYYELH